MISDRRGRILLGRETESAHLDEVIAALRTGQSRALVVHGAPGIGKSALLDHAIRVAGDVRVISLVGVESEMELAFAALHQFCSPMLDQLDRLSLPQRAGLETALRMREAPPPDNFLVGLAVLNLLSITSEKRPLLCVADDAQWLDRASAQVLGFVARRLLAESIGLFFGTREIGPELRGLPEMEVTGLRDADAHALLTAATHAHLDQRIRNRIVAETNGNPLALLELPRGLTTTQMAGGLGLTNGEPLRGRIEERFSKQIEELPEPARLLLLIAAAEPIGDPDSVLRAANRLGVIVATAMDQGADEFLTMDERVTFRHPLVRSAVYQAARPADRRAAHAALAEVTEMRDATDLRSWHLAAAATGPDESVAAGLEHAAGEAQSRGGMAAAAAFLQRSAALTADPQVRTGRVLAAAEASFQAGELGDVRRLLDVADTRPLDPLQRGRAGVLRGQIAFATGAGSEAVAMTAAAARQLESADPRLARETYLTAWGMALSVADGPTLLALGQAIRALPAPPDPRPMDFLLDGYALMITEGRAAAKTTLEQAVVLLADAPAPDVLRWGWVATGATTAVWDNDGMRTIYTRQLQMVREAGALRDLPYHLSAMGYNLAWSGDFETAAAVIEEGDLVSAATGNPVPPYAALRLLSLQGREAETAELVETTIESSTAAGFGMGVTAAHWAAAVLYNGLARYPEALLAGRGHARFSEPMLSTWLLPELVEAATRTGEPEVAREALERLVETTQPFSTDFAGGIEARTRALISEGPVADGLYREAIERLGRTQLRPELARAHLLYGEWLRRQRQRVEARHHLRTAFDMFTAIGMQAFAERARRELLATGETVRKRTAEANHGESLTAQERQIALLVRDGLSNPEVGARLFLSPRTVEWHLRKIFTKLAIESRRQLRDALPRGGA